VFGLVGVAGQGAYCAAKFAVRGFSESLRLELELDHPHVGLTCVHPGGVRTAIARNASMPGRSSAERAEFLRRWERYARLEPSEVADAVLDAVLRRHPRVVLGSDARALDALQRFSPALTRRLVARLARRDEP
jgi:NAD(P)-dependent dehydrogenase (short-subunit alcohol dehydrogenase family)